MLRLASMKYTDITNITKDLYSLAEEKEKELGENAPEYYNMLTGEIRDTPFTPWELGSDMSQEDYHRQTAIARANQIRYLQEYNKMIALENPDNELPVDISHTYAAPRMIPMHRDLTTEQFATMLNQWSGPNFRQDTSKGKSISPVDCPGARELVKTIGPYVEIAMTGSHSDDNFMWIQDTLANSDQHFKQVRDILYEKHMEAKDKSERQMINMKKHVIAPNIVEYYESGNPVDQMHPERLEAHEQYLQKMEHVDKIKEKFGMKQEPIRIAWDAQQYKELTAKYPGPGRVQMIYDTDYFREDWAKCEIAKYFPDPRVIGEWMQTDPLIAHECAYELELKYMPHIAEKVKQLTTKTKEESNMQRIVTAAQQLQQYQEKQAEAANMPALNINYMDINKGITNTVTLNHQGEVIGSLNPTATSSSGLQFVSVAEACGGATPTNIQKTDNNIGIQNVISNLPKGIIDAAAILHSNPSTPSISTSTPTQPTTGVTTDLLSSYGATTAITPGTNEVAKQLQQPNQNNIQNNNVDVAALLQSVFKDLLNQPTQTPSLTTGVLPSDQHIQQVSKQLSNLTPQTPDVFIPHMEKVNQFKEALLILSDVIVPQYDRLDTMHKRAMDILLSLGGIDISRMRQKVNAGFDFNTFSIVFDQLVYIIQHSQHPNTMAWDQALKHYIPLTINKGANSYIDPAEFYRLIVDMTYDGFISIAYGFEELSSVIAQAIHFYKTFPVIDMVTLQNQVITYNMTDKIFGENGLVKRELPLLEQVQKSGGNNMNSVFNNYLSKNITTTANPGLSVVNPASVNPTSSSQIQFVSPSGNPTTSGTGLGLKLGGGIVYGGNNGTTFLGSGATPTLQIGQPSQNNTTVQFVNPSTNTVTSTVFGTGNTTTSGFLTSTPNTTSTGGFSDHDKLNLISNILNIAKVTPTGDMFVDVKQVLGLMQGGSSLGGIATTANLSSYGASLQQQNNLVSGYNVYGGTNPWTGGSTFGGGYNLYGTNPTSYPSTLGGSIWNTGSYNLYGTNPVSYPSTVGGSIWNTGNFNVRTNPTGVSAFGGGTTTSGIANTYFTSTPAQNNFSGGFTTTGATSTMFGQPNNSFSTFGPSTPTVANIAFGGVTPMGGNPTTSAWGGNNWGGNNTTANIFTAQPQGNPNALQGTLFR